MHSASLAALRAAVTSGVGLSRPLAFFDLPLDLPLALAIAAATAFLIASAIAVSVLSSGVLAIIRLLWLAGSFSSLFFSLRKKREKKRGSGRLTV
jgi:type IV secretory pathway VirB3-like protein